MIKLNSENTYFASCPKECEELLLNEAILHGFKDAKKTRGGVFFESKIQDAFDFVLRTRIASRVYLQIHTFQFSNEKDIPKKVFSFPWTNLFNVQQTFKISTVFDKYAKDIFPNSLYFAQLMKDGIVDLFKEKKNDRPSIDTRYPDLNFTFRIEKNDRPDLWNALISLDLTGFPLSNRSYRVPGHPAPLRENLAASIIESLDFDFEKDIFIDSMAGTGTLLIEAILKFQNITPSFLWLKKGFKDLTLFKILPVKNDAALKRSLLIKIDEANIQNTENMKNLPAGKFFAYDISNKNLDILKETLTKTGLDWKKVRIQKMDALDLRPPSEGDTGVIINNPPYGKRLGEIEELETLYHDYGENLKNNFKGFKAYVFTSNPELRKKISLQTSKRIPFYNGDMECRLLRYNLF